MPGLRFEGFRGLGLASKVCLAFDDGNRNGSTNCANISPRMKSSWVHIAGLERTSCLNSDIEQR